MNLNNKNIYRNSFIWVIPIIVWNIIFTPQLPFIYQPEIFHHILPIWISTGETTSRILIFILMGITKFDVIKPCQKNGLLIYLIGLMLYFASWIVLIRFPEIEWSKSLMGISGPAFTPIVWLTGIGLMGESYYFIKPYRRWYFFATSIIFITFHLTHVIWIYQNTASHI